MKKSVLISIVALLVLSTITLSGCGETSFNLPSGEKVVGIISPTNVVLQKDSDVQIVNGGGKLVTDLPGFQFAGISDHTAVFVNPQTAVLRCIDTKTGEAAKDVNLTTDKKPLDSFLLSSGALWFTEQQKASEFSSRFGNKTLFSGVTFNRYSIFGNKPSFSTIFLNMPETVDEVTRTQFYAIAPDIVGISMLYNKKSYLQIRTLATSNETAFSADSYKPIAFDPDNLSGIGFYVLAHDNVNFIVANPLAFLIPIPVSEKDQLSQSGNYLFILDPTTNKLTITDENKNFTFTTDANTLPFVSQGIAFFKNGEKIVANVLGTTTVTDVTTVDKAAVNIVMHVSDGKLLIAGQTGDKVFVKSASVSNMKTDGPMYFIETPFPGKGFEGLSSVLGYVWDNFTTNVPSVTANGKQATMDGNKFTVTVPSDKALEFVFTGSGTRDVKK
jgi:hypothetical protein